MLPLALCHQVDQTRARFKCAHHTRRRLLKHVVGHMVEEMTLELEVDDEVYLCPVSHWRERPCVCQVLKRSPFDRPHQNLAGSIQRDLARKTFLKRAEPDLEFGDDLLRTLAVDAGAGAPRHE